MISRFKEGAHISPHISMPLNQSTYATLLF